MSKKLPAKWQKLLIPDDHHSDLQDIPAVYAIYVDHVLMYIGSTRKLKSRIRNHKINYARYSNLINTPWGSVDQVTIKYRHERELGEAAMAEIKLIYRLNPPHNKIYC